MEPFKLAVSWFVVPLWTETTSTSVADNLQDESAMLVTESVSSAMVRLVELIRFDNRADRRFLIVRDNDSFDSSAKGSSSQFMKEYTPDVAVKRFFRDFFIREAADSAVPLSVGLFKDELLLLFVFDRFNVMLTTDELGLRSE